MSIITNNKTDRLMVFIDVRNIIKGCSATIGLNKRIDYTSMIEILSKDRTITAAYVFDGNGSYYDDKTEKFHRCLEYQGFRVRSRDSFDSDERQQKEVDVDMACEILMQAFYNSYDTALLVTGDRDFVPVVERIQSLGKKVEVASFITSANKYLIRSADSYQYLDSLPIISLESPLEDTLKMPFDAKEPAEVHE